MNNLDVNAFLSEIKTSLSEHFTEYKIDFLIRTHKSLKANIYIEDNIFIAIQYNARNERIDFVKDLQ